MLCTEFTLVKHFSDRAEVEPLKCKRWSCEYCSPLRKKRLIREAAHGEPNKLITLTVNPRRFDSPDARARALKDAWTKVRRLATKELGIAKIPFLAVFERTKSGEPHLHIVARGPFLSQTWLSEKMATLIGAPVVDVRAIDSARNVAKYVSKYIGKDPQPFQGTKRYWRSLDWLDTETRRKWEADKPDCTIEIHRDPFWDVVRALRKSHFVTWGGRGDYDVIAIPLPKHRWPP